MAAGSCGSKGLKLILLSGVDDQNKLVELRTMVMKLGGKVEEGFKTAYISLCTHVIVEKLVLTEKVFGALAAGKWLLGINYITESYKKGHWLDERLFELGGMTSRAAQTHRRNWILKGFGIYTGWNLYIRLESKEHTKSFRRIMAAGGAVILSSAEVQRADLAISEEKFVPSLRMILRPGIPIVNHVYIKDTLMVTTEPHDLKKYVLDAASRVTLHRVLASPAKRPLGVSQKGNRGKIIPSPSGTQMKITQFSGFGSPTQRPLAARSLSSENQGKRSRDDHDDDVNVKAKKRDECLVVNVKTENLDLSDKDRVSEAVRLKMLRGLGIQTMFKKERIIKPSTPEDLAKKGVQKSHSGKKKGPIYKDCTVDIGKRVDAVLDESSSCCVSPEVLRNIQPIKEKPKESLETITREDTKIEIHKFVRKQKRVLNGIYCGDVVACTAHSSHSQESGGNGTTWSKDITNPNCVKSHNVRELGVNEISYFESSIHQEGEVQMDEVVLVILGIDVLQLLVTPHTIPPPSKFAYLLRELVLETQYKVIHSAAMALANRVLSYHPPHTPQMRAFYCDTLSHAVQISTKKSTKVSEHQQPWKFFHFILESLKETEADEDNDVILDVQPVKEENAVPLLRFLVTVLKEDIRHWEKQSGVIQKLVTWRIFWGNIMRPQGASKEVKQLLECWVALRTASPAVRQCVASLVTILLELMWRMERPLGLPLSPPPQTIQPITTHLHHIFKGLGPGEYAQLVRELPGPWARTVVSTLVFHELANIDYSSPITLEDLVDCGLAMAANNEAVSSPAKKETSRAGPLGKKKIPSHFINKRNWKGETALMRACIGNKVQRVEDLLGVPGIDVNLCDYSGWSALHEAAIRNHHECIRLILSYDYLKPLTFSGSVYHVWAKTSRCNVANAQLKGGDDLRTALHDAVENDHKESAKVLLDYGGKALLEEKDDNGLTPLDISKSDRMRTLLDSYKTKKPSQQLRNNYNKCSALALGFSRPTGILGSFQDRQSFILHFINSYLEACGIRAIGFGLIRTCQARNRSPVTNASGKSAAVSSELAGSDKTVNEKDINMISSNWYVSDKSKINLMSSLGTKSSNNRSQQTQVGTENRLVNQLCEQMRSDLTLFEHFRVSKYEPVNESELSLTLRQIMKL